MLRRSLVSITLWNGKKFEMQGGHDQWFSGNLAIWISSSVSRDKQDIWIKCLQVVHCRVGTCWVKCFVHNWHVGKLSIGN